MGYEYRARLGAAVARQDIVAILRAAPHFSKCDEKERFFRYDAVTREEREMPDAHAEIENDTSIYLCDNGGKGGDVVTFVEQSLRERFTNVKIDVDEL